MRIVDMVPEDIPPEKEEGKDNKAAAGEAAQDGTVNPAEVIIPSDTEEMLHAYDGENHMLNYDAIVEACNAIFGKGKSITREQYQELTRQSYRIDNMVAYARKHNFSDAVKLASFFAHVSAALNPMKNKTGRIIVIGCGQGRLAEVYVTLARKTGVKTIIQNDLIPEHLEATRQRIRNLYGNDGSKADGVRIEYVQGDILTADVPDNSVDHAYMWWFVGAEFCDPSSAEAMRQNRIDTYKRINRMLIPGGAWIDDMPDPNTDPGLYRLAVLKTAHILKERGILPEVADNLMLTNWRFEQDEGFPFQLRWAPRDGEDNKLKEKAGFRMVRSESSSIPKRSEHRTAEPVVSTIKSIRKLKTGIKAIQSQLNDTVVFPDTDDPLARWRIIKWFRKKEKS
jgi:SAM-dependent methyltransferase